MKKIILIIFFVGLIKAQVSEKILFSDDLSEIYKSDKFALDFKYYDNSIILLDHRNELATFEDAKKLGKYTVIKNMALNSFSEQFTKNKYDVIEGLRLIEFPNNELKIINGTLFLSFRDMNKAKSIIEAYPLRIIKEYLSTKTILVEVESIDDSKLVFNELKKNKEIKSVSLNFLDPSIINY